jgi:hypothetical protein
MKTAPTDIRPARFAAPMGLALLLAVSSAAAQEAEPAAAAPAGESPVTQVGELMRAELSGIDDFHSVVDILRAELFHRGWTDQHVTDVDIMLRSEGMMVHNKIVDAYDPERFSSEIDKRPSNTMLSAQRILVYQRDPEKPQSYRAKPGNIVIELLDPAVKAKALQFDNRAMVDAMREDLTAALAATEKFFRGPESKSVIE